MSDQQQYQGYMPTPNQPVKKHRKWPWVLGGVVVLIVVIAIASSSGSKSGPVAQAAPPVSPVLTTVGQPGDVPVPSGMVGKTVGQVSGQLDSLGFLDLNITAVDDDSIQPCSDNSDSCIIVRVPAAGQYVQPTDQLDLVVKAPASAKPAAPAVPQMDTVVYTVTGHHSSDITYTNSTGDISQVTDTTHLPWTYKFTSVPDAEGFMDVSAQNSGSGTISCTISINGQVVKKNSSTGAYAIVDCTSS